MLSILQFSTRLFLALALGAAIAIVHAEIFSTGNQDHRIERLAGRLTLQQGISEVSWKVIGEENDL
jgi:putative Mg2+ transporter-C (MgtC) family protein